MFPASGAFWVVRWGSAVGDICRCCLTPDPSWLLSVSSWKVTRRAAEGGVRRRFQAPTDPLDPRRGFGVRGECCPVSVPRHAHYGGLAVAG